MKSKELIIIDSYPSDEGFDYRLEFKLIFHNPQLVREILLPIGNSMFIKAVGAQATQVVELSTNDCIFVVNYIVIHEK